MKMSRLVAFSSSLLLGAALALTGAGIANADSSAAAVDYVALGDSYSSGVGAGSYDGSSCKRSSRAYPALWAAANSPPRSTSPPVPAPGPETSRAVSSAG